MKYNVSFLDTDDFNSLLSKNLIYKNNKLELVNEPSEFDAIMGIDFTIFVETLIKDSKKYQLTFKQVSDYFYKLFETTIDETVERLTNNYREEFSKLSLHESLTLHHIKQNYNYIVKRVPNIVDYDLFLLFQGVGLNVTVLNLEELVSMYKATNYILTKEIDNKKLDDFDMEEFIHLANDLKPVHASFMNVIDNLKINIDEKSYLSFDFFLNTVIKYPKNSIGFDKYKLGEYVEILNRMSDYTMYTHKLFTESVVSVSDSQEAEGIIIQVFNNKMSHKLNSYHHPILLFKDSNSKIVYNFKDMNYIPETVIRENKKLFEKEIELLNEISSNTSKLKELSKEDFDRLYRDEDLQVFFVNNGCKL